MPFCSWDTAPVRQWLPWLAAAMVIFGLVLMLLGAVAGAALANGEPLFNAGLQMVAGGIFLCTFGTLLKRF